MCYASFKLTKDIIYGFCSNEPSGGYSLCLGGGGLKTEGGGLFENWDFWGGGVGLNRAFTVF